MTEKTSSETFDAILPAGGRIREAWAQDAGSEIKTLLTIGGETILERTIRVLRATPQIGRIVVIGPPEIEIAARAADVCLPEGETGPDNIFRGLRWLQENQDENRVLDSAGAAKNARVLVMTTDLPFVTSDAISGFLHVCSPEIDICIPIVERTPFEVRFPDAVGFWVPLDGRQWTLGCAFLLRADAMWRSQKHIEAVFAARKSQLQMARLLGFSFIARLLLKKLSIAQVQRKCERVLDCRGQVVCDGAPELAFDIDDEAAFRYATQAHERLEVRE